VGINLGVLPFRSDQDKFSERMYFRVLAYCLSSSHPSVPIKMKNTNKRNFMNFIFSYFQPG
jgi:hypothetical protein